MNLKTPLVALFCLISMSSIAKAATMAEAVDYSYTKAQRERDGELTRDADQMAQARNQNWGQVDKCKLKADQKSFGDALEGAIGAHLEPKVFTFSKPVLDAYQLPADTSKATPVSIVSHPYCEVSKATLAHMLGDQYVPSDDIISILQHFTKTANEARQKYWDEINLAAKENRKPRPEMLQDAVDVHFAVLGCVSYEEALSGPGDQGSEKTDLDQQFGDFLGGFPDAQKYFKDSKGNYVRPKGLNIYTDRPGEYVIELRKLRAEAEQQKKNGTFNQAEYDKKIKALKAKYTPWFVLGNFQFTPDAFGNIRSCVEEWNKRVKDDSCKIDMANNSSSAVALSSPAQTFNSYCGAAKIAQADYSQVNTASANGTDLANILPNGSLKAPKDRCISITSSGGTGRVYAHYGPLRNSVKDNLGKVMGCVDGALKFKKIW